MKNIIIPIIFLLLFIIFVYGALFVGTLGIANWSLHIGQHSSNCAINYVSNILIQYGVIGVFITAISFLSLWILINFLLSNILYIIIKVSGNKIAAYKTYNISIMALFHIFAMPVVLWSIIRKNNTFLMKLHYKKLRKLALSTMMQERLIERKLKSTNRSQRMV